SNKLDAVFLKVRNSFEIVGVMSSHLEDACLLAFPFYRFEQVGLTYVHPFGYSRSRKFFSGFEIVFYLSEDPRIAYGSTSNHDAVYFELLTPGGRALNGVHISVAEDRDFNARVAFYLTYQSPVCFTFVELCPGTAVDGKGFNTHILESFGHFIYVFTVVVPA